MLNARQQMWGVETTKRRKRRAAGTAASTTASTATAARAATPPRRPKRVPRQLSLAEAMRTRGGPRKGAGRKRKDPTARPNVVHRVRPAHRSELPVHITLRRAKGLPGFRSERLRVLLEQAIRDTRREGFRITHYSVQADHVHIIVEAEDPTTLTNGMRSFAVRIAMRVNRRILGRTRGRVWGDQIGRAHV
jgi:putative transposase